MARAPTLLILLVPLLVAGCFGKDTPAATEDSLTTAEDGESAASDAGATAGSAAAAGANATEGAADNATEGAATPEPREMVVAETGELSPGADVCQSDGSSMTCLGIGDAFWSAELDLGGALATSYSIALSWTAATPASASLAFTLVACDANDGCAPVHMSGTSPLTQTGTNAAGWKSVSVFVSPMPHGAAGVSAYLGVPQPFALDGTMTVIDAPPTTG